MGAHEPVIGEAIINVVQKALNSKKGISIEFPSVGEAIHWHQRYNTVRSRLVKGEPGHEWRTISCRRVGQTLFLEPVDAHILRLPITEL